MGLLDRLLGREPRPQRPTGGHEPPTLPGRQTGMPSVGDAVASQDERAIARYRYLLRTAPPERLEEVHAEAFGQLSPDQRQQVLGRLSQDLPPGEGPTSDDPRDLARAATRAEMRQPGYLPSAFAGPGLGTMMAGSMLGTVAGFVVGSAIVSSLLGDYGASPEAADAEEAGADTGGADAGDAGGDELGGDLGGGFDGGDFGGFDL